MMLFWGSKNIALILAQVNPSLFATKIILFDNFVTMNGLRALNLQNM
jgi:hypothetical protein